MVNLNLVSCLIRDYVCLYGVDDFGFASAPPQLILYFSQPEMEVMPLGSLIIRGRTIKSHLALDRIADNNTAVIGGQLSHPCHGKECPHGPWFMVRYALAMACPCHIFTFTLDFVP
jgi:hypothetical protein